MRLKQTVLHLHLTDALLAPQEHNLLAEPQHHVPIKIARLGSIRLQHQMRLQKPMDVLHVHQENKLQQEKILHVSIKIAQRANN